MCVCVSVRRLLLTGRVSCSLTLVVEERLLQGATSFCYMSGILDLSCCMPNFPVYWYIDFFKVRLLICMHLTILKFSRTLACLVWETPARLPSRLRQSLGSGLKKNSKRRLLFQQ